MTADCGACNLCCFVLGVPDIHKPARMWCEWTTVHGGCARQADKASDESLLACAQFECLWLQSQQREGVPTWPRTLRPDQSHVVFGPQDREDALLLFVHVDPRHPKAWKEPAIQARIQEILDGGGKVEVSVGERKISLP